jgi:hypothetical protein
MVARTCLIVTIYVHCLSRSINGRYPGSVSTVTGLREVQPGGQSLVLVEAVSKPPLASTHLCIQWVPWGNVAQGYTDHHFYQPERLRMGAAKFSRRHNVKLSRGIAYTSSCKETPCILTSAPARSRG